MFQAITVRNDTPFGLELGDHYADGWNELVSVQFIVQNRIIGSIFCLLLHKQQTLSNERTRF